MEKPQPNFKDEFSLTFRDMYSILRKKGKAIWTVMCLCAFLALLYAITRPIEYQVEATFKDKGKSQSGLNQSLTAILLSGEIGESNVLAMMKSRRLVEEVVAASGLQVEIAKAELAFPILPLHIIRDNILSEYAFLANRSIPALGHLESTLVADNVYYPGEVPLALFVVFHSEGRFEVSRRSGAVIGGGMLGVPFIAEGFQFTLKAQDGNFSLGGQKYNVVLSPLGKTAEKIAKKFKTEADRHDKNLLKITYRNHNRHQAVSHLNAIMAAYQNYIAEEHRRINTVQIKYLQERQQEMGRQLEEMIRNYANNLSSNLSSIGVATYDKAMEFLTFNQQNFIQKILAIDLEVQWLLQAQQEGKKNYDKFNSSITPEPINLLSKEIRTLKQRADTINLALINSPIKQLSLEEFQGIDLSTARQLYVTYIKDLNDLESNAGQQQFLISQINHPDFEISSLSSVMDDPISAGMIAEAGKLNLSLRDSENRTQKEQDRIKSTLEIYKEFFVTHLGQELQLIDLRRQIIKEKILVLQCTNLALIQERISILENQMAEYLSKRLTSLKRERVLYEDILKQLKEEMALLPHKWVDEKLINQQMQINQSLMEEISRLVESKNITNNLETIQATPIDLPLLPLNPRPPHLLLLSIFGAAAGAFLSIVWVLGMSVVQGVEASEDNLHLAGQQVAGQLSYDVSIQSGHPLDSDLDTLRRLIVLLGIDSPRGHAVLLLIGKGPNYVPILAELMSKMGLKTLIISACFDQKDIHDTEAGLLQYLEGKVEHPSIVRQQCYDVIPAGGITRYSAELMATGHFGALLKTLQERYDWILVCNNADILSAEAESLFDRFPNAAVSLTGQPLMELGAYTHASQQCEGELRRIAFILT